MSEVHLPHHGDSHEAPVSHETSDVAIRPILGFLGVLTIVAVFINFAVWLLFNYFYVRSQRPVIADYPLATQQENRLPPEPRLQTQPREDLRELRAQEDAILTTFGWVDRNAGIVRIPVDQAMKMVVERGLPSRPGSEPKR